MYTLLIILEIIVSILLILVILMQASKGGGLAGTFGGANVGMVFGVRRTADFLTKATQILGIAFGVIALIINLVALPRSSSAPAESVIQTGSTTRSTTTPQLPPAQAPVLPEGGTAPAPSTPPQGQ
jgi:preprotein translocase subunit SecG